LPWVKEEFRVTMKEFNKQTETYLCEGEY